LLAEHSMTGECIGQAQRAHAQRCVGAGRAGLEAEAHPGAAHDRVGDVQAVQRLDEPGISPPVFGIDDEEAEQAAEGLIARAQKKEPTIEIVLGARPELQGIGHPVGADHLVAFEVRPVVGAAIAELLEKGDELQRLVALEEGHRRLAAAGPLIPVLRDETHAGVGRREVEARLEAIDGPPWRCLERERLALPEWNGQARGEPAASGSVGRPGGVQRAPEGGPSAVGHGSRAGQTEKEGRGHGGLSADPDLQVFQVARRNPDIEAGDRRGPRGQRGRGAGAQDIQALSRGQSRGPVLGHELRVTLRVIHPGCKESRSPSTGEIGAAIGVRARDAPRK
jgi:hypothetical protein